ncbi:aromatic amino acid lyase [Nocardia amamiensis]|uniref:aromatic amino acid lyase n=1 Tax=Nocardia amamiensis TaxID=404578 RepID=UPI0014708C22|nr:aromatic amino acid lyase [Nocardia amamiensis]
MVGDDSDDVPPKVVRAAVLARLWSLAREDSGASVAVLSTLTAMLGTRFAPAVPMPGGCMLGADSYHSSFTYIAGALRGEGHAFLANQRMPAVEALHGAGLTAASLDDRDERVLVSGTSLTTAATALALASVRRSHAIAVNLTAVLMDFLGYGADFPPPEMLQFVPHPQVAMVILQLRHLLAGSTEIGTAPIPYDICLSPDLLGAASESIRQADIVVDDDLNGSSDTLRRFPEGETVHNRHLLDQPTVFATDLLTSSTVIMANLVQLQLDLVVEPHHTNSSQTEAPTPEQHRVLELKALAITTTAAIRRATTPPSLHSAPADTPDRDAGPFSTHPALKTLELAAAVRQLHGILAVTLRHALHISGRRPTARASTVIIDQLIEQTPPLDSDQPLLVEIHHAAHLLDKIWRL